MLLAATSGPVHYVVPKKIRYNREKKKVFPEELALSCSPPSEMFVQIVVSSNAACAHAYMGHSATCKKCGTKKSLVH